MSMWGRLTNTEQKYSANSERLRQLCLHCMIQRTTNREVKPNNAAGPVAGLLVCPGKGPLPSDRAQHFSPAEGHICP